MKKAVCFSMVFSIIMSVVTVEAQIPREKKYKENPKKLQVVDAWPAGDRDSFLGVDTDRNQAFLSVTFNQEMVSPDFARSTNISFRLLMNPPLRGSYRWRDTRTLMFIPETLPDATLFSVTVPAGVRSASGLILDKSVSWSFKSRLPRLMQSSPFPNQSGFPPSESIFLTFNMPVSSETVRAKTKISRGGFGSIAYDLVMMSNVAMITPSAELDDNGRYLIEIQPGLLSTNGGQPSVEKTVISFQTRKGFRYEGDKEFNVRPGESVYMYFNEPVSIRHLVSNIIVQGSTNRLDPRKFQDNSSQWLYLNFGLKPRQTLTLRFTENIRSVQGSRLRPFSVRINSGDYYPGFFATGGQGYIESYMSGTIKVGFVNMKDIRMRYFPVDRDLIVPVEMKQCRVGREARPEENDTPDPEAYEEDWLGSQDDGQGDGTDPSSLTVITNISMLSFNEPQPNVMVNTDLPVKRLFGREKGIVRFAFTASPQGKEGNPVRRSGILQFTELGITCKFTPFQNLIYVTKLRDTTPVEDALVEVRNSSNRILFQGRTDRTGFVSAPGWYRAGTTKEDRLFVIVEKDGDLAYIRDTMNRGINPVNCLTAFGMNEWGYNFWSQPLKNLSPYYKQAETESGDDEYEYYYHPVPDLLHKVNQVPNYNAFLFTERGLYRPGEEVFLKVIAKYFEDNGWLAAAGISVTLTVLDGQDRVVLTKSISTSPFGSAGCTIPLAKDAATGYYTAKIENESVGIRDTVRFQVEEFKTSNFEVIAHTAKDYFIAGDVFEGTVKGWFLFGAPMAEAEYEARIRLKPYDLRFKEYPGFNFFDRYRNDSERFLHGTEGILDAEGLASVSAELAPYLIPRPMRIVLEGVIQDKDRQIIAGSVSRIVHPAAFYLGVARDGYFYERNKPVRLRLVALNPDGTPAPARDVTVKVSREEWRNVKEVGLGNRVRWHTDWFTTNIETRNIRIDTGRNVQGTEWTYKPEKAGYHTVEISSVDSRGNAVRTSTGFYVSGWEGYVSWAERDDDIIELVKDKDRYNPGDTARIIVKSPFEKCKALVTVEREGLLDRFVIDVRTSMPIIEIPIREEYLPNVYISVVLLKGRTWMDQEKDPEGKLGKPAFKLGYINLPVEPAEMRLKVDIAGLARKYEPGDSVSFDLSARGADGKPVEAEFTVAVVDEGVLNLIGYTIPSPFDFFHRARPLLISTLESRNYIIEQRNFGRKGENAGGGGGQMKAGMNFRGKFIPTAYYEPSLVSDLSGKARVTFRLPDNLTSFRVMVVANTRKGPVGQDEDEFIVNKPLMLKESLPMFVRPGDSLMAGVTVHNLSGVDGEVNLVFSASNVNVKGRTQTNFFLKNGSSREILFPCDVSRIGPTVWKFDARLKDFSDAMRFSIPSLNARGIVLVSRLGNTTNKAAESFNIPERMLPGTGNLRIGGAASGLSFLNSVQKWLDIYPYGCLEQKTSCVMPLLLTGKKMIFEKNISPISSAEFDRRIRSVFDSVSDYQQKDGGYYYWSGQQHASSPTCTAYACYAMALAKKEGIPVNEESMKRALDYLQRYLSNPLASNEFYNESSCRFMRAQTCYLLAFVGQPDRRSFDELFASRTELSLSGQAFLLKTAKILGLEAQKKTLSDELVREIRVAGNEAYLDDPKEQLLWYVHESRVRCTAMVFQALMEADAVIPHVTQLLFYLRQSIVDRGYYLSTQDNAAIFHALTTYFQKYESQEPDFTMTASTAGRILASAMFKGRNAKMTAASVPLDGFIPGSVADILLEKKGTGSLFYDLQLEYSSPDPLPAVDNGIGIRRTIRDAETGSVIQTDFVAGKNYVVTLDVDIFETEPFVMLEDQLPAGFQIVNERFATTSEEDKKKAEIRQRYGEDEWWYYWWSESFDHIEYYKDRVNAFADRLYGRSHHKIEYVVRAVTPGTFILPPAKAEVMYNPSVHGRTGQDVVTIREISE
jgi:uncharacterized protein YfaS (alpha-2-macroglobulin family)